MGAPGVDDGDVVEVGRVAAEIRESIVGVESAVPDGRAGRRYDSGLVVEVLVELNDESVTGPLVDDDGLEPDVDPLMGGQVVHSFDYFGSVIELLVPSKPGGSVQAQTNSFKRVEVTLGDVYQPVAGVVDCQGALAHEVGVVVDCHLADPVVLGGDVDDTFVTIRQPVSRDAGQTSSGVRAGHAFDRTGLAEPDEGLEHA